MASTLRAQDLRQWMPNVGDQFVYDEMLTGFPPYPIHDTVRVVIDSIVVSVDSAHQYQVYTHGGKYPRFDGEPPYIFSAGDSAGSQFPFVISVRRTVIWRLDSVARYDFSKGSLEAYQYSALNLTVAHASSALVGPPPIANQNQYRDNLWYAQEVKWFVKDIGDWFDYVDDDQVAWNRHLISAWNLAVNSSQPSSNSIIRISESDGLLGINLGLTSSAKTSLQLLDILGRPIHAWAMEVAAGESQITLNASDVPSGMYFLRLSAPGVEEVRKVCIAH